MKEPKKWTELYPYGTKEGDEEAKIFRVLSRGKYDWRSTAQIVKSTGLTRERVEEILDKYNKMKPPLIFAHESNEDHWGYWERCREMLKKEEKSLSDKDKTKRVEAQISTTKENEKAK